jgi:hypothetical protein
MTETNRITAADSFSILNELVLKLGLHMHVKSKRLSDPQYAPPSWEIEITLESSFTCFGEGGNIKTAKKCAAQEMINEIEHLLNAKLTISKTQLQKIPSLLKVSLKRRRYKEQHFLLA